MPTSHEVTREVEKLRARLAAAENSLAEAKEVIRAIQSGEVDAVVVSGTHGEQVFTLKGAEYAYRVLVEAMYEGAATLGADGTVLYCNQHLADLLGIPLEQIIGSPASQFIGEQAKHTFESLMARALNGDAVTDELELHPREERSIPVHVSLREMQGNGPTAICMVVTNLMEQKKWDELLAAQAVLRKQAELLKLSFDAIIVWRMEGVIEGWNSGAQLLYGYTESEALGRKTHELLATIHPRPWPEIETELMETGFWEGELCHRAKDGREIVVSARKQIIRDADGGFCVLETNRDITERQRAEEILRESEAKFRSLFENSLDAVFLTIPDGEILAANPAACAMFGWSEEELRKMGRDGLTDDSQHAAAVEERRRTGRLVKAELNYVRRNGQRFTAEVDSVVLPSDPPRCFVILRDITERKRAEEALRRSEARLRALVMASTDAVYRMSPDWSEMRQLRGRDFVADTDTPSRAWLQKYVHPDDQPRVMAGINEAIRSKGIFELEHRVLRADGSVGWTFSRAVSLQDANGEIVEWFGAATDITGRKRTEEALLQSEKLASMGRMAATIAHEINNPLETIGNAIYLASTDAGISQEAKSYLEMATQELERVTHITKQTLAFHRSNKKPAPLDLRKNIDGLLKIFAPRLESREIAVEKRYAEVGPIMATSGEIQQIVSNLLSNGMDAVPSHGKIWLRISRSLGRNGCKGVRFTIADNGSGIPQESLKKIFEPFYTTKELVGTGLGLWVTKQIVEKHGATIHVRSKIGRGTVFSLVFPTAEW